MTSPARDLLHLYLAQQAACGVSHVRIHKEVLAAFHPTTVDSQKTVLKETEEKTAQSTIKPSAKPVKERMGGTSKKEKLERVSIEAAHCEHSRSLGTLRDIMVFATGNSDADIMFIGEAPGVEEEKQCEPFVGPAGQLLTKVIQAMGLRRCDVYISNICKYRPKIDDGKMQGGKNRAPTEGEMHACQSYIMTEIEIIEPKVIVALGSTAAKGLGIEGTVGKLRGAFQNFRGIPTKVTYHPSYLLRREQEDGGGITEKRLVWEDMMQVMERVGLPISAKQRGYFSKTH